VVLDREPATGRSYPVAAALFVDNGDRALVSDIPGLAGAAGDPQWQPSLDSARWTFGARVSIAGDTGEALSRLFAQEKERFRSPIGAPDGPGPGLGQGGLE